MLESPGWSITTTTCGENTRAVYLDDPRGSDFGYFYKACWRSYSDFVGLPKPEEICLADGGMFTNRSEVFLDRLEDFKVATFHPGYDDLLVFKTLACNSYMFTPDEEARATLLKKEKLRARDALERSPHAH